MNIITKVSEITTSDLCEYLHITEYDQSDLNTLNNLLGVAESFIKNYTGQDDLDSNQEFVIAVLILVQNMWDNRSLYDDSANLNKVVDSILGMHSVNLLPEAV